MAKDPDPTFAKLLQGVLGFLKDIDQKADEIRESQQQAQQRPEPQMVREGVPGLPSAMSSPQEGGGNARRYTQILFGREGAESVESGDKKILRGGAMSEGPPAEEEGAGLFGVPPSPATPRRRRPPRMPTRLGVRRQPAPGSVALPEASEAEEAPPPQRYPSPPALGPAKTAEIPPGPTAEPVQRPAPVHRKRPMRGSADLDEQFEEAELPRAMGIARMVRRAAPIPKAMPIAERIRDRVRAKPITTPWDFLEEYQRDQRAKQELGGPEFEPRPGEPRRVFPWETPQEPTAGPEPESLPGRPRPRRRGSSESPQPPRPDAPASRSPHAPGGDGARAEGPRGLFGGISNMMQEVMAPHLARAMGGGGAASRLGTHLFAAGGQAGGAIGGIARGAGAVLAGGGMGAGGAMVGGFMGGAGGAAAGAMGGAMAASAALGPLGAISAAAVGLGHAFEKLRESALEANKAFAQFSPAINVAQNQLERQQLVEQVQMAHNTGGTGRAFLESEMSRSAAEQPLKEFGTQIGNLGGMLKNGFESLLLENTGINSLLRIANRYLARIAGKGDEPSKMPFVDLFSKLKGGIYGGKDYLPHGPPINRYHEGAGGRLQPGQGFGHGIPRGGGGGGFAQGVAPENAGLAGGQAPQNNQPRQAPPQKGPGMGFGGGQAPGPAAGAENAGGQSRENERWGRDLEAPSRPPANRREAAEQRREQAKDRAHAQRLSRLPDTMESADAAMQQADQNNAEGKKASSVPTGWGKLPASEFDDVQPDPEAAKGTHPDWYRPEES